MSRNALVKGAVLTLVLAGLGVLALTLGPPDVARLRARVDDAGAWGPVLYVTLYVGLSLIPCPKSVLTAAGGALFGLVPGAALALGAALVGAVISFLLGRVLGRDAVDRLTRDGSPRSTRRSGTTDSPPSWWCGWCPCSPTSSSTTRPVSPASGSGTTSSAARSAWCRAASPTRPWAPTAPTRGVWPPRRLRWWCWSSGARGGRGGWIPVGPAPGSTPLGPQDAPRA